MASRNALRFVSRRFSSGKVLGKEEQAAENVYIKKMEQEKLEKLARKGPAAEERSAASSGGSDSVTDSKPGAQGSSSTFGVSTDIYRNYGVLAGFITGVGALGWYWMSRDPKKEEIIE
ncbi:unnamed protein product [Cuscuta campestris]|uniref:Uncharacterized protein n=2 Tax=Cuscuta sect. Cleistogrammica TaxID=1824901 RepID=A0A484N5D4_9ASTE|nr:hypothetical protein DM860_003663 [Cuscuta australis]VFQ59004.1 unnamed protein product [Cuscuta campestris]VFQ96260.1 unnamed protein product [Cuscuta campestris]